MDKSLDLAVFTFDQIETLESWRFWAFRYTKPAKVNKGDIVHFVGFPGEGVRAGSPGRILYYSSSSRSVHDVGCKKFVLHAAAGTMHHTAGDGQPGAPVPIGGASGAPVFKVCQNLDLDLAGIISELSSCGLSGSTGDHYGLSDGDIYATYACFIQANGSIGSFQA